MINGLIILVGIFYSRVTKCTTIRSMCILFVDIWFKIVINDVNYVKEIIYALLKKDERRANAKNASKRCLTNATEVQQSLKRLRSRMFDMQSLKIA